jgi:hypothetical protein
MTFALILYAQYMLPIVIHGYVDKSECERAATFINDPVDTANPPHISHSCVPEHYSHD